MVQVAPMAFSRMRAEGPGMFSARLRMRVPRRGLSGLGELGVALGDFIVKRDVQLSW